MEKNHIDFLANPILCKRIVLLLLNLHTIYSPIEYQLDTPSATLATVNVHHTQQLKFHFSRV